MFDFNGNEFVNLITLLLKGLDDDFNQICFVVLETKFHDSSNLLSFLWCSLFFIQI